MGSSDLSFLSLVVVDWSSSTLAGVSGSSAAHSTLNTALSGSRFTPFTHVTPHLSNYNLLVCW